MIRPTAAARGRSGITLTEILISILIMGVGMISLATLFPLGLSRMRAASRQNRSALLSETLSADVESRNLLSPQSFLNTWYTPYGSGATMVGPNVSYNPLINDPPDPLNATANPIGLQTNADGSLTGLGPVVCYDPLWRHQANQPPFGGLGTKRVSNDFRFANGQGVVRADPDGSPPSAHGLQRITNLPVQISWPPFASTTFGSSQYAQWNNLVGNVFASQDDPVFQAFSANPTLASLSQGKGSPLVPDLSSGGPQNDWSYTWMFTGRQTDVSNPAYFDGDIVIFQNRPYGVEALTNTPASSTFTPASVATGETVVEAVWGYAAKPVVNPNRYYYDPSPSSRTVLLRWPSTVPDPDVRVGGWIADVTYERVATTWNSRFGALAVTTGDVNPFFPAFAGQRCIWYRVAKKTNAEPEIYGDNFAGSKTVYRQMVVTTATPLRAKTLMDSAPTAGSATFGPVNVNAALVAPSVVNVFSQVFYSR